MPESRKRRSFAEAMAKAQKEISVSEFFEKNRHLLGFDNPRKVLFTTVKETVDNSLDACEEAGILPEIWVHIDQTGKDRYKVAPQVSHARQRTGNRQKADSAHLTPYVNASQSPWRKPGTERAGG